MTIGRVSREDHRAVPSAALREAVINAVVHADYAQAGAPIRISVFDDRLEVENPGVLLPGLTFDDIRSGVSKLRNRVIGRVFRELGLIEQWGSGIQRMAEACRAAGLPEPSFTELALRFRCTIWTIPAARPLVDERDAAILDQLGTASGLAASALAARLGVGVRSVQARLARLRELGLVGSAATGPRDPRRRWFRSSVDR
jgi:DNA-binding transcriptional ArsR family regulator